MRLADLTMAAQYIGDVVDFMEGACDTEDACTTEDLKDFMAAR